MHAIETSEKAARVQEILGAVTTLGVGALFVASALFTGFDGAASSLVDIGYIMIVLGVLGFVSLWGVLPAKLGEWVSTTIVPVSGMLLGLYGLGLAIASSADGGILTGIGPIIALLATFFTTYLLAKPQVRAYLRTILAKLESRARSIARQSLFR